MKDQVDQNTSRSEEDSPPMLPLIGPHISLVQEGERIVLESTAWRRFSYQLFVTTLLAFAILLSIVFWLGYIQMRGTSELVGALVSSLSVFLGIWTLVDSIFVRRFEFDFQSQICRFTHIPGFGLEISFQEIESIDVLIHWLGFYTIGLAHIGKKRRLRVHIPTVNKKHFEEALNETKQLNAIFGALSKILNIPIRTIEKATTRMNSWR